MVCDFIGHKTAQGSLFKLFHTAGAPILHTIVGPSFANIIVQVPRPILQQAIDQIEAMKGARLERTEPGALLLWLRRGQNLFPRCVAIYNCTPP